MADLGEGHIDEKVDTAADGKADVTGGPQDGNPGGTCGEVVLKGRANEIYKTQIFSSYEMVLLY